MDTLDYRRFARLVGQTEAGHLQEALLSYVVNCAQL